MTCPPLRAGNSDQLSWIHEEYHKDHCETTAAAGAAQLFISVYKKVRFNPQTQQEQSKKCSSVGRVSNEICMASLSLGRFLGFGLQRKPSRLRRSQRGQMKWKKGRKWKKIKSGTLHTH